MDKPGDQMLPSESSSRGKIIDDYLWDPVEENNSSPMDIFDLVGGREKIPLRASECHSSEYIKNFLTDTDSIKEDCTMKRSVMEQFLREQSEAENSHGDTYAVGKEDEVLGTPNADEEDPIADGMAKVSQISKANDSKADSSVDTLMGDDVLPGGNKTAESTMIHTKEDYTRAVNALFLNLCEISLLSYLDRKSVSSKNYKTMLNDYYKAVVESAPPSNWKKLSEASKLALAKKIAYFQEKRNELLGHPTKRYAKLVEGYYVQTSQLLSEVDGSLVGLTLKK
jgi:hypothetical protein